MKNVGFKEYFYGIVAIIFLTGSIMFIYDTVSETILGLIKGDDYLFYDFKQIPLLLLLPVVFYFDLLAACLFLPFKTKIVPIIKKIMPVVWIYTLLAFFTGLILSIIISIYPLSTEYYQCKPTSIVSSGSYYAKSKETCKQNAYQPSTDETQSIIVPERNELKPTAQ